jgi:hypothetical protein
MMYMLGFFGVIGAVAFGAVGLARGDAGQLERILAIACIAMAAAGLVGNAASTPTPGLVHRRPLGVSLGDLFSAIAIAPVVALCVGVFLLTLIPSIYVALPVLVIWWFGSETGRPHHLEPMPEPLPVPATVT